MIDSKRKYIEYKICDKIAIFGRDFDLVKNIFPMPWNYTYQYLRCLRKYEYICNCKHSLVYKYILKPIYRWKLGRISVKTGISIPKNTFGKGLGLFHYGSIVVNEKACFGDWCVIQSGVNIAENVRGGNYVYLAPGCKINRNIVIQNNCCIGSNAVITKDIHEEGITLAGVPANKISEKGFHRVMGIDANELNAIYSEFIKRPLFSRYRWR